MVHVEYGEFETQANDGVTSGDNIDYNLAIESDEKPQSPLTNYS